MGKEVGTDGVVDGATSGTKPFMDAERFELEFNIQASASSPSLTDGPISSVVENSNSVPSGDGVATKIAVFARKTIKAAKVTACFLFLMVMLIRPPGFSPPGSSLLETWSFLFRGMIEAIRNTYSPQQGSHSHDAESQIKVDFAVPVVQSLIKDGSMDKAQALISVNRNSLRDIVCEYV